MLERDVLVGQLEPGDWVTRLGDWVLGRASEVDRVTAATLPGEDPEVWGVSFTDDSALVVSGKPGVTATLGFPDIRFAAGMKLKRPKLED